ncbi:MAG: hypothetical protein U0M61_05575 [Succinivibrio sp.]|nr:hypothetical protein [Succinivibrio sp.]MEE0891294.1 hypothetical protein [Succinivibrio sp.]
MNGKVRKSLVALSISALFLALTGCNSNFFDSSVGPDGAPVVQTQQPKKVKTVKRKRTVKKKPAVQTAKETKAAEQVAKAYKEELKAGEIKPYIPEESDLQNQSLILPTIDGIQEKSERSTALNKVGLSQVVNGKVDLNKLQAQEQEDTQEDNSQDNTLQEVKPQITTSDTTVASDTTTESLQESEDTEEEPETLVLNNDAQSLIDQEKIDLKAKCGKLNTANIKQVVYKLAYEQANRLKNDKGPIYIAPTVIPSDMSDCVKDVSSAISVAFRAQGLEVVQATNVEVAQNQGSSTVIPSLVRACKSSGIPLLNVSVLRVIGGEKHAITIRNIRVKDGITLVQNTNSL